jgi:thiamine biosynthesis protein ThiI
MRLVSYAIATVHEIALKGANRGWFERTLLHNIRAALKGLPVAEITLPARVVIRFVEPAEWSAVFARLSTVFGINGIIPVERAGATYEQLERFIGDHLPDFPGATFAVRCKRSDKRFPLTSEQVNRRLGEYFIRRTGTPVDLDNPEVTIHVLVQADGLYVYRDRYPGPGGLPVGTSGRVLVLLSGGIDSPVAAYLAMKRGTKAHYVHFHSAPYTSDASVGKVERLVRVLTRHQGASRLAVVPFGDCQREIVSLGPERLRVVLYRRMMLRTAERIARRWRCEALVTGDALNQVASQTLENLAAIDRVAHMPVLRPLISMDKQEIIAAAERAGTYELSLLPHQDCCSFLQPQHPATRTTASACDEAEAPIDVEGWARRLQHEAAVTIVQHRWDERSAGNTP